MTDSEKPSGDQQAEKPAKKAAKPNSMWATGKRRVLARKAENKGFARGARVK